MLLGRATLHSQANHYVKASFSHLLLVLKRLRGVFHYCLVSPGVLVIGFFLFLFILLFYITGEDLLGSFSTVSTPKAASKPTSPQTVSTPNPLLPLSRNSQSKSPVEAERFFTMGKPLDGIISCFTRNHDGNLRDKGIVSVTSKSILSRDPEYAVRNVVDLDSPSYFLSRDEPHQWICWNFHGLRIKPTHFTIKGRDKLSFMNSWTLEGSLDQSKGWKTLHYSIGFHTKWEEKSSTECCRTFAIYESYPYSFFRLTQTGETGWRFNSLTLCSFEIFGTFLELPE
jgi:hypothetical protein